jgi:hypothetical protein
MEASSVILMYRYCLFVIVIISNAIVCSAAAWNLPISQNADLHAQLHIDIYMIFLGAFTLLVVIPILFIDILLYRPFIGQVWVECLWVQFLWLLHLGAHCLHLYFRGYPNPFHDSSGCYPCNDQTSAWHVYTSSPSFKREFLRVCEALNGLLVDMYCQFVHIPYSPRDRLCSSSEARRCRLELPSTVVSVEFQLLLPSAQKLSRNTRAPPRCAYPSTSTPPSHSPPEAIKIDAFFTVQDRT